MPAFAALLDLGVLLALVTLIGLRWGYSYSLGKVLLASASLIDSLAIHTPIGTFRPLGFLADDLVKLDHAIMRGLGRGIDDMKKVWNQAASVTATAFHWIGLEIASITHDTAQAIEGLHLGQVPRWILKRLPAGLLAIAVVQAAVKALQHDGVKRIERITHVVTHRVKVIERVVMVPNVGALPRTIPNLKWLTREATATEKWIRAHSTPLLEAGVVGAVAAVLFKRLGLGWLRCKGVNRVGRSLCGLSGLIETLFSDAIEALIVADLCQFVGALNYAVTKFEPVLLDFVDVETTLIGCHGATRAPAMGTPRLSLPPVTGLVTN